MTDEQRKKLHALAEAARPQPIFPPGNRERDGGDDWGSDRQAAAEEAFHIFARELGIDISDADMATEEMIDEVLRRAAHTGS